jgi:hypothetical protein
MRIRRGGPGDADGTFDVRGWIGQVFSMRLGHQPGTLSR